MVEHSHVDKNSQIIIALSVHHREELLGDPQRKFMILTSNRGWLVWDKGFVMSQHKVLHHIHIGKGKGKAEKWGSTDGAAGVFLCVSGDTSRSQKREREKQGELYLDTIPKLQRVHSLMLD